MLTLWKGFWEGCLATWRLCRPRLRCAIAFSLAFKAINFIVLAPLAAGIMSLCLRLWGRPSAGNFEIAAFFLSPVGIAALVGVGSVSLASLYLELSGLLRLLADRRLHWWEAFRGSTRLFYRLLRLGFRQVGTYLLLAGPFLAGIGLTYWWFWHGRDLNGLLILKPPEFLWGAGIAATLMLAYALVALPLFLRQLYAVPILILESVGDTSQALRLSAQRSRGARWQSAWALAAWFVLQSVLAVLLLGLLHIVHLGLLRLSSGSITTAVLATGTVFAVEAAVSGLLSIVANISLVGIVLRLYQRSSAPSIPQPAAPDASARPVRLRVDSFGWQLATALLCGVLVIAGVGLWALQRMQLSDNVEITAHRAGAIAAPENTVAALKQAIVDLADWVEIDVQLTADKQIVVIHDSDLARVGGESRRVNQLTLEEIQAIDVGARFSPGFTGERIPTLQEIIAAAADKIRLNVELKPNSNEDVSELTRRVVQELQAANLVSRSRLCSQSYESLQLARQLEPKLEVGYIEGAGVGDSTKLEVNFLMVKGSHATSDYVARAKARGKQVHAWTVNDADLVAPLLDAGVGNIITDDPALIRTQLETIRVLSAPERLLLRAANALSR